tara:strand:- start:116 stop:244 length:129 start_codon:yes stop_codon:yes gene_type:complete
MPLIHYSCQQFLKGEEKGKKVEILAEGPLNTTNDTIRAIQVQ